MEMTSSSFSTTSLFLVRLAIESHEERTLTSRSFHDTPCLCGLGTRLEASAACCSFNARETRDTDGRFLLRATVYPDSIDTGAKYEANHYVPIQGGAPYGCFLEWTIPNALLSE